MAYKNTGSLLFNLLNIFRNFFWFIGNLLYKKLELTELKYIYLISIEPPVSSL